MSNPTIMVLDLDLNIETTRIVQGLNYEGVYLNIKNGIITVKKGFIWNGCTWARDGERGADGKPVSWKASCVHDALYRELNVPVKRETKDLIFYDELKKVNFKFLKIIPASGMYYLGVRLFANIFNKG